MIGGCFVGKLGKEVVDQIHVMLEEGYNKTEVAAKLGINRKTVASYAVDTGSSLVQRDSGKMSLSLDSGITKVLYEIQGVMGASSIVGAVKQVYLDVVSVAKFRVTHWPIYACDDEEFTTEAMIQRLIDFIDYQESSRNDDLKALFEAEAEIERLKEFAEERYEEGLEQGRQDHAIYVRCVYCGKPYQVTPLSEIHGVVTQVLLEAGWGHGSCVMRDEYDRSAGSRALEAELRGF